MRWPRRIYKRRPAWHWLADAGAPAWVWRLFTENWWAPCDGCGQRRVTKNLSRSGVGGGRTLHFCGSDCDPTWNERAWGL